MRKKEREQEEARVQLREILKPGDTVTLVLRHTSRSGMYRTIDCYKIEGNTDGTVERMWISRLVATATGNRFDDRKEAVGMSGCGMDMGLALVHELSYVLHGKGFTCTGERCPSNEHSNGDRDRTPHEHKSGGYSLRHDWMV